MIRVQLPAHLRLLAKSGNEVELAVEGRVSINSVLDALELKYPTLCGTVRDHVTKQRRPFIRFFACGEDYSLEPQDVELPAAVANGTEPLLLVGAIAGG